MNSYMKNFAKKSKKHRNRCGDFDNEFQMHKQRHVLLELARGLGPAPEAPGVWGVLKTLG